MSSPQVEEVDTRDQKMDQLCKKANTSQDAKVARQAEHNAAITRLIEEIADASQERRSELKAGSRCREETYAAVRANVETFTTAVMKAAATRQWRPPSSKLCQHLAVRSSEVTLDRLELEAQSSAFRGLENDLLRVTTAALLSHMRTRPRLRAHEFEVRRAQNGQQPH